MKKILLSVLCGAIILGGACSKDTDSKDSTSKKTTKETSESTQVLSKEEFEKMHSNPKEYKGKKVDFYAQIFVEPERDKDGTYIQAWADKEHSKNTIIAFKDPKLDVKREDYIHVKGTIKDVFEGENAFGGKVKGPTIVATSIEKTDYATAFDPAKKTIEVNQEQDHNGYKMIVKKIEIADKETRVYFTAKNDATAAFNFYDFNSKLIVGGQQLEYQDNYEAKYPKIPQGMMPGVTSDAVLTFPKLPIEQGELQLILEGSSENYDLKPEPFNYKIKF
ncbi:DUF4352 domain-containing protein [Bacillus tropicus]|uniref:DUF4352 domain-containing protein n=1 Tax=Bacillus tropicus TaxID=2026188 RepID=UPI0008FE11ED|nr:DUF4352 domain-containing protein [Bacillus tropicus]MDF9558899.1 DUF4352 domain-containing protein [Bacillus tropicus]MDF9589794.1 DUF4352 domain-containing protein [Bacillus tropicus]MDF9649556.1 DUF4352 domain-containing protein [Bacillus tropicus]OJE36253.1 DUF4352 domain-containing protein [Bacillus tropicus]HDR7800429.1 DUF4352 domain-containing protein [Bacillus tropicus]